MKTTVLLNDEAETARLMLKEIAFDELGVPESETHAGCNCDRWGHPCPGCVHRNVEPNAEDSDFIAPGEMSQDHGIADSI